jgi:fermentation-respiration switch protein FrsA (DUF1100 family)
LFHPQPLASDYLQDLPSVLFCKEKGKHKRPENYQLIKAQEHYFESKGKIAASRKLHGWLFALPESKRLLLLSHGNSGNMSGRLPLIEFLVNLGFSVFIYDYRGFGRSEGKPSVHGVLQDGLSAYDYVREALKGALGKDFSIALYGESLGASISSFIASRRDVSHVVLQSGFCDLRRIAIENFPFLRIYPSCFFPEPALSSVKALARVKVPLLVIHGKKDLVVPYHHALAVLEAHSGPRELLTLEETSHSDLLATAKELVAQKLQNFFAFESC